MNSFPVRCEVEITCKFTVIVHAKDESQSIKSIRQDAQDRAESVTGAKLVQYLPETVQLVSDSLKAKAYKVIADGT